MIARAFSGLGWLDWRIQDSLDVPDVWFKGPCAPSGAVEGRMTSLDQAACAPNMRNRDHPVAAEPALEEAVRDARESRKM